MYSSAETDALEREHISSPAIFAEAIAKVIGLLQMNLSD